MLMATRPHRVRMDAACGPSTPEDLAVPDNAATQQKQRFHWQWMSVDERQVANGWADLYVAAW